jgi:hypothetical protein
MPADPLHIIEEPSRARSALQPVRLRLLHLLDTPQSHRSWRRRSACPASR